MAGIVLVVGTDGAVIEVWGGVDQGRVGLAAIVGIILNLVLPAGATETGSESGR